MGEEVKMSEYEINGGEDNINGDDERVDVWEIGLPAPYDLTPLSQPLIPPELASAFSISPEPHRTPLDVNRASQNTLSNLRGQLNALSSNKFKSFNETTGLTHDPTVVELEEEEEDDKTGEVDRDGSGSGSEARKWRRIDSEEADSALRTENSVDDPSSAGARTLKRPRLVWTPQLHKRFVDVVGHLGIKNAVPKTIMQWMNVEGLTRENVASHLQKYRLYLKRKQGLSNEGPSASDQLFASTPVPQSLHESGGGSGGSGNGNFGMPIPMPYHHPATAGGMMPMPVYGHMGMQMVNDHVHNNNSNNHQHQHQQDSMNSHQNGYNGNVALQMGNNHVVHNNSNNHQHQHQHQQVSMNSHQNGYNGNVAYGHMFQQRDWNGNNYGSYSHHPYHAVPNDNM